jgi:Domain of unknown function (DUF802)
MTRFLFATAFLLGSAAVIWMASIFLGSDALAFTITMVIGFVFILGVVELHQFRQASQTLANALDKLPDQVDVLEPWLQKLDPSLQNSVQVRIEGERVGLPTPVITPYLVGLLVMLGLLGTFVGMVDTLKGAVMALEGSTELAAIRAGLAAPINGLSLAFGTSVAGVAASAMLGLMSTVSRRERMQQTRCLDTKITSAFRTFSLVHNRQETFKALQMQAQALPNVADKLGAMAGKLEVMGDRLSDNLIAGQQQLYETVQNSYTQLADSVNASLKETAADSGRLAADSGRVISDCIKPIVAEVMADISREIKASVLSTHEHLTTTAEVQLVSLTGQFKQTSEAVTDAWQTGLTKQERSNELLTENMTNALGAFSHQFESSTNNLLTSFDQKVSSWVEQLTSNDKTRLERWTDTLGKSQKQATTELVNVSERFSNELKQVTDAQHTSLQTVTQDFETLSLNLADQWQQAGQQSISDQQALTDALQESARNISDVTQNTSGNMLTKISELLASTEQLINARITSEQSWLENYDERTKELTSTLKTELTDLKVEEERRAGAAVERLGQLQSAVTEHLATLGKELEAPMTRLIETASETPRAAAEVIEHLRREISNNNERDNQLLEERRLTMEQLDTLSKSLAESSASQREAMETMVGSSADMLKEVGSQFTDHLDSQASKLSDAVAQVAGSTTDMSSFGDAFGHAVELFNQSNENLVEHLTHIEQALDQSSTRSDEQLGYYVAQAREIIDHSILSQQQMLESLRKVGQQEELFATDAN